MDEMEQKLVDVVERLNSAAIVMEEAAERLEKKITLEAEASVGKIVATVASAREEELERKLAEAEARIVELQASSSGGRKTVSVGRMVAKEGSNDGVGALDAALSSLTVEQRLAVKGELLRAGLVGGV